MPLDINQLAPVALWLTVYSDVASNPKVSLPAWLAEERPEAVKFAALPLATYSALVEELRATREVLREFIDPCSFWFDLLPSYNKAFDHDRAMALLAKARAALSGGAS